MASYTLNADELKILRYMADATVVENDTLKCKRTPEDIAEDLGLVIEDVRLTLDALEEVYVINRSEDNFYIMPDSVFSAVMKKEEPKKEETTEEINRPFRLNGDTANRVDDDEENVFEDQHLDFSEIRDDGVQDADEYMEEKVANALSEEEPAPAPEMSLADKKRELARKRMQQARKDREFYIKEEEMRKAYEEAFPLEHISETVPTELTTEEGRFSDIIEEDNTVTMEVGDVNAEELPAFESPNIPDVTVKMPVTPMENSTPTAGETSNLYVYGDYYNDTEVENAYADQHVEFKDMRGGDLSAVSDNPEVEDVLLNNQTNQTASSVVTTTAMSPESTSSLRTMLQNESIIQTREGVSRVSGDALIPISNVSTDNMPQMITETPDVIGKDIRFITDGSTDTGYNSYADPMVNNTPKTPTDPTYQKDHGHTVDVSENAPEPIKAMYNGTAATTNVSPETMATFDAFTGEVYNAETIARRNSEVNNYHYEGVRDVRKEVLGATILSQQKAQSLVPEQAQTHSNSTVPSNKIVGTVSGKIDYDISTTKSGAMDIQSGNPTFNLEKVDIVRNREGTQPAQYVYDALNNIKVYNFSRLAKDTTKNQISSAYHQTMDGINHDYTADMRRDAINVGSIGVAVTATAVLDIMKSKVANEEKAFSLMEKISNDPKLADFNANMLEGKDWAKAESMLMNAGYGSSQIKLIASNRQVILDEINVRNEVFSKLNSDPTFLAGSGVKDLRKHLLTKGYKSLSADAKLRLIDELTKTDPNPAMRVVRFAGMYGQGLTRRQINKLEKSLNKATTPDERTQMLLRMAKKLQAQHSVEMFRSRHRTGRSMANFVRSIRPMEQDIASKTFRDSVRGTISAYNKAKLVVWGVPIAYGFGKKAIKNGGNLFKKVGNLTFKRVKSLKFTRIGEFSTNKKKVSLKVKKVSKDTGKAGKNVLKNFRVGATNTLSTIATMRAVKNIVKESMRTTQSSAEEEARKEKIQDAENTLVQTKHVFQKVSDKAKNKAEKDAMKNAGNGIKNKAKQQGMKNATKSGMKNTTKKATKKTAKAVTKTAEESGKKAFISGASNMLKGLGKLIISVPLPVWILIIILILILFIVRIFQDSSSFVMGVSNGAKASQEIYSEFATGLTQSITDGITEMNESVILVSTKPNSYDDEYADIDDYLKKCTELDEKREKNAIEFANARIGTYSPESKGLNAYQTNGRYGQDASILNGHRTDYYGSDDKEQGYTLHYMDAYGNEIANHSTNAQDILALCAVMYGNMFDSNKTFPILVEDQWYLMNPAIKWKESDIYTCNTCTCDRYGYYDLGSYKYNSNHEVIRYHCNDYYEVQNVQYLSRSGAKVEGDIRGYDSEGCKYRTLEQKFYRYGDDTYDLYLDGWISYDDYLYYWYNYYDEYIGIWGYKTEWYCDGDHTVSVCYGHKDVDLYITLYDIDYASAKNIYPTASTSKTGKYNKYSDMLEEFLNDGGFSNDGLKNWAKKLYEQDWYELYNVSILGNAGFRIGGTLSDADIESILGNLSDKDLSIKQQAIVEFALRYVGKIPYYWGGKASSLDFEENNFGSTVEADYKGRTSKGLDCSGFVAWVMANNGIKVPSSTAGYSGYQTTRDHSQLKVGDLGFKSIPGSEDNHIGIYAGVDENGRDLWIHCTGSGGTVVNNYNGFKHYVSLGN